MDNELIKAQNNIYDVVRSRYAWKLQFYDELMIDINNDKEDYSWVSNLKEKLLRKISVESNFMFQDFLETCLYFKSVSGVFDDFLNEYIEWYKYMVDIDNTPWDNKLDYID